MMSQTNQAPCRPVNTLEFIRIQSGWEALAISRPDDSCTPACFRTGSIWPKPSTVSQNQTGSGLVLQQYYLGCLWKDATESKGGKLVAGRLRSARTEADDSCASDCFWI